MWFDLLPGICKMERVLDVGTEKQISYYDLRPGVPRKLI